MKRSVCDRYGNDVTSGKIKMKGDIVMAGSTKKEESRGRYTAKIHKAT
jgi:hypothetical protein